MMFSLVASLLLMLAGLVLYRFVHLGMFAGPIEPWRGEVLRIGAFAGPEDLATVPIADRVWVSSTERTGRDYTEQETGIWSLLKKGNVWVSVKMPMDGPDDFQPHGISALESNGEIYLFAVNHRLDGTHSIEKFRVEGDYLWHQKTYSSPLLSAPNDIVAVSEGRFYVSNEGTGRGVWERSLKAMFGSRGGEVLVGDGANFRVAADDMVMPNGIEWSAENRQLFVADTLAGELLIFEVDESGELERSNVIEIGSGIDNITLDGRGKLWVAQHLSLLRLNAFRSHRKDTSSSQVHVVDTEQDTRAVAFSDSGESLSGITAALYKDGNIFLGSIKGPHVLVVPRGD